MATTFAPVQISDASLKMNLYITMLTSRMTPERYEKVVILATETFLKFMESEQFCKEAFDKTKALAGQRNYYALLLLDQMLKNNKHAFKNAKREIENIFKGVWERAFTESENTVKLETLKLLVKVWGYIYGQKYEESLRKWIEQSYRIKFTISPENEAELKQIYGTIQQPKQDFKMEELINNIQIEEKPKKSSNNLNDSLFEALGIDQN